MILWKNADEKFFVYTLNNLIRGLETNDTLHSLGPGIY